MSWGLHDRYSLRHNHWHLSDVMGPMSVVVHVITHVNGTIYDLVWDINANHGLLYFPWTLHYVNVSVMISKSWSAGSINGHIKCPQPEAPTHYLLAINTSLSCSTLQMSDYLHASRFLFPFYGVNNEPPFLLAIQKHLYMISQRLGFLGLECLPSVVWNMFCTVYTFHGDISWWDRWLGISHAQYNRLWFQNIPLSYMKDKVIPSNIANTFSSVGQGFVYIL